MPGEEGDLGQRPWTVQQAPGLKERVNAKTAKTAHEEARVLPQQG